MITRRIGTRVRATATMLAVVAMVGLLGACSSSAKATSDSNPTTAPATTAGGSTTSATTGAPVAKLRVTGERTVLTFGAATMQALTAAGITAAPVAPATAATSGAIDVPISGGTLTQTGLQGTIDHHGGISFVHAGKTVAATDLVLNTVSGLLSGTVNGKEMALLAVELGRMIRTTSGSQIVASGITWTLVPTAATFLNGELVATAFKPASVVGTLTAYVTGTPAT